MPVREARFLSFFAQLLCFVCVDQRGRSQEVSQYFFNLANNLLWTCAMMDCELSAACRVTLAHTMLFPGAALCVCVFSEKGVTRLKSEARERCSHTASVTR